MVPRLLEFDSRTKCLLVVSDSASHDGILHLFRTEPDLKEVSLALHHELYSASSHIVGLKAYCKLFIAYQI